jgi:Fic family protein
VLGHWLFGYIHPYMDGNGRMARFLMNAMLASGGYSWTVVRVEDRARYLRALDSASIDLNIEPFATFLAERVAMVDCSEPDPSKPIVLIS